MAGARDLGVCLFFFFKQKTAYEIVSGDWSSDVCSSDLKQKLAYEIVSGDWSSDVCSSDLLSVKEELINVIGVGRMAVSVAVIQSQQLRSEERRVGKECLTQCRTRWWQD